MNLVAVESVGKRYRPVQSGRPRTIKSLFERVPRIEQWALHDVSLTVARGEALGLVGANGAGKSTLLRLVAGLTRATHGTVRLNSVNPTLLTLGAGFHPVLRAEENVVTEAILAGLTRQEARARLAQIASFAELEDHMGQPLRTFSDGMRLRLAFATAISVDPELLLVDEVLAVGDIHFRQKCFARLEELRERGVTIVLASHDLGSVRRLCQRVVWLADGRVRDAGHTAEVLEQYEKTMNEGGARTAGDEGERLRLGTQEIQIEGVRLYNDAGMPVTNITTGSGLTITVAFRADEPAEAAIVAIGIHGDHDGIKRLDLSTADDGRTIRCLRGEGEITLHVDRLDLPQGQYHVEVGIYGSEWVPIYDYLWKATPLTVVGPTSSGLLAPPHSWRSA